MMLVGPSDGRGSALGEIDNRGHLAETFFMRSVSFATFVVRKGSLQTG
jgi:hypothetical protein